MLAVENFLYFQRVGHQCELTYAPLEFHEYLEYVVHIFYSIAVVQSFDGQFELLSSSRLNDFLQNGFECGTQSGVPQPLGGIGRRLEVPHRQNNAGGIRVIAMVGEGQRDRKSTRLNYSHLGISYAV